MCDGVCGEVGWGGVFVVSCDVGGGVGVGGGIVSYHGLCTLWFFLSFPSTLLHLLHRVPGIFYWPGKIQPGEVGT